MENFQNDCCRPFDQQSFQELVFKAFKNRKRNGCVERQNRSGMSDRLSEIYFSTHFVVDDDNCE